MAIINSVAGPLDTTDLGFTLMHEHIIVQSPGVGANFPVWDRQREIDKAVAMVKEAMARGVKTLVDLTPGDWRDIPFVQEVVRRTSMQVVVARGLYYDVPRHFRSRDADYMARLFAGDIQEGILDTGVKAAIISAPPTRRA